MSERHGNNVYPYQSSTDSNLTIIWDETISPRATCFNCKRERVGAYAYSYTVAGEPFGDYDGSPRIQTSPRGLCDIELGRDLIGIVARGILPALTFNDYIALAQQRADDGE
jgi:hypothetical protein